MKNYLSLLTATLFVGLVACNGESSNDQVEQKIDKEPALILSGSTPDSISQVYLYQVIDDALELTDSAIVAANSFVFKEKKLTPQMVYLTLDNSNKIPVFIENNEVSVDFKDLTSNDMTVSGSSVQKEWELLQGDLEVYDIKLDSLYNAFYDASDSENQEVMDQIGVDYDEVDSLKTNVVKDYINANSKSYVTPYLIAKFLLNSADLDELVGLKDNLDESISNSIYVKSITDKIENLEKTKVGATIPDFSQADKDGTPISINDLRGQYVLVDFWASWCGPCRGENPNVVKEYQKYKDRGFTVLGVSLDDNKENWLKAIEVDNLDWYHVSDLQGWKNAVAKQFGVQSIPFSILIDKEGVILGKNLRGEELQNTLSDLFQ
jgi:peroxiredoxin